MPMAVLLLAIPAWGQSLPDGSVPAAAGSVPDAPAAEPVPLASRYVWEQRGTLDRAAPLTGIAVQPGATHVWLVVDARGSVYRTDDQGATWTLALWGSYAFDDDDAPSAEKILLDAEATRDEEIGTTDAPDDTSDDVDAADEAANQAADAASTAAETATALRDLSQHARTDAPASLPTVWFDPADPTLALLGRPDGTWRSLDAGRTWDRVDDGGISVFFSGSDPSLIVAGATSGVRFSLDRGATWIGVEGAAGGTEVHGIAEEKGWIYAATESGLFRSRNGLQWERVDALADTAVQSVVPDPDWDGGLWVATDRGLLRTDDDAKTFYSEGLLPAAELRRVVHAGGAGHVLAISGRDGVWESMDGGVRWAPAFRLLGDPDVRAIDFETGIPVIATATGVWRMVTPAGGAEPARAAKVLDMGVAIGMAQRRAGLDSDMLTLAHREIAALLAPKLQVNFDWTQSADRTTKWAEESTTEKHSSDWGIVGQLCWGNCGGTVTVSSDSYDGTYDADATDLASSDLYVVDGEVFDDSQSVIAAANVAQSIRAYREHLHEQVSEAWLTRQRLATEAPLTSQMPLHDQVMHALKIAELDARLDIYTDGAFTRALTPDRSAPDGARTPPETPG
jgi:hypothetical protein